ncbi:carbohydrate kinase [Thermosipho sp. 1063]|uniref:FGGY-family carbohydrate kinase n=1 Tax=unclassified Thermosipho (in: thermotogales) TaxID=2676525 RepID=UPI00094923AF|nr:MULTISPECIES: FGGY-family carbohydrate kinase [unclassified Thermosipho (in: thermotogales)]ANQ53933.1 carbohydrate kinase [Thermosipho sp. 1070]APT72379.1 carbohydrate kinase [Thermosipho sp. 1063]OOC43621.1 carbohydrate kinase [Thermosipho sp. 1074]
MNYAISIDCGTQSLRALLFDENGKLHDIEKITYVPYFSTKPGLAEQDVEIYWNALSSSVKRLKERNKGKFSKVLGVSITTQRDTIVFVDKEGKPLRPAIIWLDQRKASQKNVLNFIENIGFSIIRMKKTALRIYRRSRPNWVMENEPDVWKKTHKILLLSGYLLYKLTGKFIDSKASQIGHIPFDYKKQDWPKSDKNWRWRLFGFTREQLPKLVDPCISIGKISKKVSQEIGLPEGIDIITSGSDKGCETLGTGCITENCASLSFGTTATVQVTSKKYFEPIPFIPPYPAVIPNMYNPEIEIFRGYWLIKWFIREFGEKEISLAEKLQVAPEVILNKFLDNIPPGSHGLILYPMWTPGLDMPNAKGAIIGFGDIHTKGHIYRAIIEGINYALRDGLERIEKKGKIKINRLTVSGGGAQSNRICQITANMFNLPVYKTETHETSGLGAAICVFAAFSDIKTVVKKMVHYSNIFQPNEREVEIYEKLYNKAYKKVYSSLKNVYKDIKKITNYPED